MLPITTMFMSTTAPSTATSKGSGASSGLPRPSSMQSRPSMASDTVSTNNDEADLALKWSRRWTLAHRILALNLLTVLLVPLSTLYLDVFRNRLSVERTRQTKIEAVTTAEALAHMPASQWPTLLAAISRSS